MCFLYKIPLKYKQYDVEPLEETIKRLHYTNTWPMWASENISKGNSYFSLNLAWIVKSWFIKHIF